MYLKAIRTDVILPFEAHLKEQLGWFRSWAVLGHLEFDLAIVIGLPRHILLHQWEITRWVMSRTERVHPVLRIFDTTEIESQDQALFGTPVKILYGTKKWGENLLYSV